MTYSVPRTSATAFGVAALVALSALSAARADSASEPAQTPNVTLPAHPPSARRRDLMRSAHCKQVPAPSLLVPPFAAGGRKLLHRGALLLRAGLARRAHGRLSGRTISRGSRLLGQRAIRKCRGRHRRCGRSRLCFYLALDGELVLEILDIIVRAVLKGRLGRLMLCC